ncbi:unnamed protein product [Closterium sp. Naga37s-1]|nr:unnamed protein product [Closterium sp. Naga37s-1]
MFVLLEGRTRDQAFTIGNEIVTAVTALSPTPVALKLEKVYHPCVLQAKKRYVGLAYESPAATCPPVFDAKGIETVRRDGCPAVSKLLEKSLKILFSTNDLSRFGASDHGMSVGRHEIHHFDLAHPRITPLQVCQHCLPAPLFSFPSFSPLAFKGSIHSFHCCLFPLATFDSPLIS